MKTLSIDIETYSEADLMKVGVYRYVNDPSFEILLFAYSWDDGPEFCVDLTKHHLPYSLVQAVMDPKVLKTAWNAQFERVCLTKHIFKENAFSQMLDPEQWKCTMVRARQLGLPGSLGKCAEYLNIDQQKDKSGTLLINYFSKPCKPTKANGKRTRNLPEHDPEKWERYIEYCIQDVRTEKAVLKKVQIVPLPESEWQLYWLDQRINDRGVEVDQNLASGAVDLMDAYTKKNLDTMKRITDLQNPNSLMQLKGWLESKNEPFESLNKTAVEEALKKNELDPDVRKVLHLRLETSNSSTKKYIMMKDATCSDGRIRGLLQFYGASRTGRWAGRLLQVQNLPRNYMDYLDHARDLVKQQDGEAIDFIFGSVPETLKQLIRTGLVAKEGHTFLISDYAAIEARVLAWYAGEKWAIEAFRQHGKIYEATASQMFRVPLDQVDKELRQKGKVATLALGYQGSVGAMKAMGALEQGLKEDELQPLVDRWRKANKNVVNFWYRVQDKAMEAVRTGNRVAFQNLVFIKQKGILFIGLPSGRKLAYPRARLAPGKYGDQIVYDGQGSKAQFETIETYGGKLVENIVQATARDILAEGLLNLEKRKKKTVFHVHDEVVVEAKTVEDVEDINRLISQVPEWAKGLPLGAEGFKTDYYMKD